MHSSALMRKKCNPLGLFMIDPYCLDRTPEGLDHHNPIVGNNCSNATVEEPGITFQ